MTAYRTGNGIDVHRFSPDPVPGSVVILGGIEIPHDYPLLAHSDGDVISHALMDALLGALAMGDIGTLFPDTDPGYAGASSLELLAQVRTRVAEQGWRLGNADITVVAQAPKVSPHTDRIRSSLARTMQVDAGAISVKATTSEGLGFTGRGEGIAVFATVLLVQAG